MNTKFETSRAKSACSQWFICAIQKADFKRNYATVTSDISMINNLNASQIAPFHKLVGKVQRHFQG